MNESWSYQDINLHFCGYRIDSILNLCAWGSTCFMIFFFPISIPPIDVFSFGYSKRPDVLRSHGRRIDRDSQMIWATALGTYVSKGPEAHDTRQYPQLSLPRPSQKWQTCDTFFPFSSGRPFFWAYRYSVKEFPAR